MRDFQGKEMGTKYNYYVSVSIVIHNLKLYHFCHPSQQDMAKSKENSNSYHRIATGILKT